MSTKTESHRSPTPHLRFLGGVALTLALALTTIAVTATFTITISIRTVFQVFIYLRCDQLVFRILG